MVYDGEDHSKLLLTLTFKDGEAILEGDDAVKTEYARIKIKLDPAASPKIMDFNIVGGLQKGTVVEGIYEFKANELHICAKVFGNDRPKNFESSAGSNTALLVLKRPAP